jgi:hypothetical protein
MFFKGIVMNIWDKLAYDDMIASLELYIVDYEDLIVRRTHIIRNYMKNGVRWMHANNGESFVFQDSVTYESLDGAQAALLSYCKTKIPFHKERLEKLDKMRQYLETNIAPVTEKKKV